MNLDQMTRLERLVHREYGGDPMRLLSDLAVQYGIAIAYITPPLFSAYAEERRGSALTDEEVAAVRREIGSDPFDYDQWVDNTLGPSGNEVSREYMAYTLDLLRITPPEGEEKWES